MRSETIVKSLLEHRADVNARDYKGSTPLMLADRPPKDEVPSSATIQNNTGDTTKLVEILLDHGAEINAANEEKITVLHIAAWEGNEAVLRVLLNRGADVNAGMKDNSTPLDLAVEAGHEAAVKTLLDNGARNNRTYRHAKPAIRTLLIDRHCPGA
jgi:ankyrin repeat protein